jgi:TetR/AcrR family transcriptional regulator, transcriptional repressor for nem operon
MRDAILKLAEQQLLGGGYDKLNFATIAKELNTTRANLHYHFKNKESLAIEVTEQYGTRNITELKYLRDTFKGDFFGFFNTMDNSFWSRDNFDEPKDCIMLATDPDIPVSLVKLVQGFHKKAGQVFTEVIQEAINNGEIRDDIDAQRESVRCQALMMGIMTCGQHLSSPKQAQEQMSGLITDWANSLK